MKVHGRDLTQEEINHEMKLYGRVRSDAEVKLAKSNLEMRRVGQLLLANEDGKLLLSILEEMHHRGDLRGKDPYDAFFNLGRRDVVEFLLGLRDQAKEK